MGRPWDVHLLAEPEGTGEDPYDRAMGAVIFRHLPLIALPTGIAPAERFTPLRTWRRYPDALFQILHSLDAGRIQGVHVYRLSLGLLPSYDVMNDPLTLAINVISKKNRIIVAAAGNWGPRPNTLSGLARIPGVISVGASDSRGVPLSTSSRGVPGCLGPTFIANGLDPTSESLSGTSLAAARVAVLCLWIRSLLRTMQEHAVAAFAGDDSLIALAPASKLAHVDTGFTRSQVDALVAHRKGQHAQSQGATLYMGGQLDRLAWFRTTVDRANQGGLGVTFSDSREYIVRILRSVADRAPCVNPASCGHGFVTYERVRALFSDLTPSKFLRLFTDDGVGDAEREALGAQLDAELGPLWTAPQAQMLEQLYASEYDEVFIEIHAAGASAHGLNMLEASTLRRSGIDGAIYAHIDQAGEFAVESPS